MSKAQTDRSLATLSWLKEVQPERAARYENKDIGAGRLFADWSKYMTRYVAERGKWYSYNGVVWEPDEKGLKTMELCKELADALMIYAIGLPDLNGGRAESPRGRSQ